MTEGTGLGGKGVFTAVSNMLGDMGAGEGLFDVSYMDMVTSGVACNGCWSPIPLLSQLCWSLTNCIGL